MPNAVAEVAEAVEAAEAAEVAEAAGVVEVAAAVSRRDRAASVKRLVFSHIGSPHQPLGLRSREIGDDDAHQEPHESVRQARLDSPLFAVAWTRGMVPGIESKDLGTDSG
jgi:hypothetical protein